ncbi:H-NS family nucleoid-associated regulatory protein [Aestuariibius sp. 2305UL40-4]|uniref:H-NS histone family protein n=1 Tax=Aestuariibius violaceus TaxID=3234132 RepID=UPI00398EF619
MVLWIGLAYQETIKRAFGARTGAGSVAKIRLDKLSLDELKNLQKEVAQAITSFEKRQRDDALAAIQAAAKEHGYSLDELMGGSSKKTAKPKTPAAPKYRHPENPEMTWSGRGRQPKWIKDALADGKTLDDYLIQ